ncbi:hypothetical protein [Nocardiopsis kunsanensis]|uniref:Uncharacterized protein n=1 Tax=Nocardiopsis kunsanensis TaxID=141693 RepID=A0A918X6Y1_9ACTN|nr:hypothetical protein [Nocardiopsis kunsanensis]GHD15724.1 hypothetical protein GCM10007147_03410 [Nocardiopsis kunsanensis]
MRPEYAELRGRGGPSRVTMPYGGEGWLAVDHADVRKALTDRALSRSAALGRDVPGRCR